MATIKEVAKLAGVSLGTVSNVLNGKTQNEELIRRVEKAVQELNYHPDINARSLKSTQSTLIGIVLPNPLQKEYSTFLLEVESKLRAEGYGMLVKFSQNNKLIEKKSIESCLRQSVAGILVYTNLNSSSDFKHNGIVVPHVIINGNNVQGDGNDCVRLDYSKAFQDTLLDWKRQGIDKIGLIMEKHMLENPQLLNLYYSYCDNSLIKIAESGKEQGFQAFFELYTAYPEIQAVLAGSSLLGMGVKKAMSMLDAGNICVAVIKESCFIEDMDNYDAQLTLSQREVADLGVQKLLDAIQRPNLHEPLISEVCAAYDKISTVPKKIPHAAHSLVFAMYDCSSSRSLQMLSRIYEKKTGVKIDFELYPYGELEELLYQRASEKDDRYDGFMMDVTWLEGMIENGGVANLDELLKNRPDYFDGFVDGVVKEYGMYVESLYAIPFMSGSQILFYQKDLFEDKSLQMRFQRMYNEKLMPPGTWAQFNLVAEFFTKSCNEYSPVKYGTTLPNGLSVYTALMFLSHLWAYGSDIFDEKGNVVIENSNSAAALRNYVNSLRYTSGKEMNSWNEIADEFASGASAMTILYDSDAGNINNYTYSKVAGNLGCALLPGGKPVLGGWSLGLNRYGRHQKEALNFLLWACGDQNSMLLTLLGGSTFRKEYYERTDLEHAAPWKNLVLESYRQSKKRFMPEILDESRWKNNIYTRILPEEIVRVIAGEISEKEALSNMRRRIEQLVFD